MKRLRNCGNSRGPGDTRRRTARRALALVTLLGLLTTVAACGDDSSSASKTSSDADATSLPTDKLPFTVGIVSPNVAMSGFYYALETGVFDEVGLDLKVVTQGSVQESNIAAGKLVIGDNGTTNIFPPIAAGRKIVSVIGETTGVTTASVTVRADSGIDDLMDLSGKKVGIVGCCGAAYGSASSYSDKIVADGGDPLTIQVMPDIAGLTSGLESGQLDAAVFNPVFGKAIAAGLFKEIIATDSDFAKSIVGEGMASITYHGLADTMAEHRTEITRLVAGLRIAYQELEGPNAPSAEEIAATISKNETFAPSVVPTSELTSQVKSGFLPFMPAEEGYISKETWDNSLDIFSRWKIKNADGTSFDLTKPEYSWENTVDMSYYDDADALVDLYFKKHEA